MKINVPHIAKLANLPISSTEEKKFKKQLEETIDYVKELDEVKTNNVEPTSHVTGLENVLRDDIAKPSLSQEDALLNTNSKHNGFFMVNAVIENDE